MTNNAKETIQKVQDIYVKSRQGFTMAPDSVTDAATFAVWIMGIMENKLSDTHWGIITQGISPNKMTELQACEAYLRLDSIGEEIADSFSPIPDGTILN